MRRDVVGVDWTLRGSVAEAEAAATSGTAKEASPSATNTRIKVAAGLAPADTKAARTEHPCPRLDADELVNFIFLRPPG